MGGSRGVGGAREASAEVSPRQPSGCRAHSEQVAGGGLVKPEARRPTCGLYLSVGSADPCFRSSPFSLGPCSGLGPAAGTV